jgi:hypothetical protein
VESRNRGDRVHVDAKNLTVQWLRVPRIATVPVELRGNVEWVFGYLWRMPIRVRLRGFGRHINVRNAMNRVTVTNADVQISIWAKGQAAAIVFSIGPVEFEQYTLGRPISTIGIRCGNLEFRHSPGVCRLPGERRIGPSLGAVIDVEQAVLSEVRMEREGQ